MTTDANALDITTLAPALEKDVPGFSGLKDISQVFGGQSNPTYFLTADSGKYVLRSKPAGKLLKSAHQVDREYRVLNALKNTDVPVPETIYLSEEDSAIGRMFYIMKFLDGRILKDLQLRDIPLEDRAAHYDSMNDVLARLHSVDIEAAGLSDYGRPGNYFARQLSTWTKQYRASETENIQPMEELISWLSEKLPEDDGSLSLVHGDYRLDNVMFHNDKPEIIGVLDWELSTLGHPMADLAYQCMYWRMPHDSFFQGLGGLDRKAVGLPEEQDFLEDYCKRRGLSGIDNWSFYLAFVVFRLSAILQGVYKRSLDGNASDPQRAKAYGAAVPLLSGFAMQMINEEN